MLTYKSDTICAIATPPGIGAIAIVRLSGEEAIAMADRVFQGRLKPSQMVSRQLNLGRIVADDVQVDQAFLTVMRAPRTFTGEDTVEVNCHGGHIASRLVLKTFLAQGARLAEPGEFTKRAFLNRRIDLIQAEAIGDLIHARTEQAGLLSTRQLSGYLSGQIRQLREELFRAALLLEMGIDFSDDESDAYHAEEVLSITEAAAVRIVTIHRNILRGHIVKSGVRVTICGKENVGKSSIFNYLLNKNRAIVTDIPGTTRDILEDVIHIDGILFRLFDTAGIRDDAADIIEAEGIRRSRLAMDEADIVIFTLDASRPVLPEEQEIYQTIQSKQHIVVLNKCDLQKKAQLLDFIEAHVRFTATSTVTGDGFNRLSQLLSQAVLERDVHLFDQAILSNERQEACLNRAMESLTHAVDTLKRQLPPELVAVDVQGALRALSEIIGEITTDDIINTIFAKFCIGK